jgi:4-aminobutyrate aminotransferase-like enzyme
MTMAKAFGAVGGPMCAIAYTEERNTLLRGKHVGPFQGNVTDYRGELQG